MDLRPFVVTAAMLALAACSAIQTVAPGSATDDEVPSSRIGRTDGSGMHDPVVVQGPGWSASSGLSGPVLAPGSCHYRYTHDGEPLPDPRCTPGAVTDEVTPQNLKDTICRRGGYAASARPPREMTDRAKRALMAAYGVANQPAGTFEFDHEIPIGVGGSPGSVLNLWPEPNSDRRRYGRNQYVHNDKDHLEAEAHDRICSGNLPLRVAQGAFGRDWTSVARLVVSGG